MPHCQQTRRLSNKEDYPNFKQIHNLDLDTDKQNNDESVIIQVKPLFFVIKPLENFEGILAFIDAGFKNSQYEAFQVSPKMLFNRRGPIPKRHQISQ
ncbi:hypothetical protein CDAR_548401 [Caerostris darwini]|uniref:Uncharacterized protein n=1 Tax=Caerostris darwini TaxID=1538125 RepID=A0AAV4WJC4_9ARAC|nr:hypothetical protein CDAR_548401 [Caerostris darwini]